MCCYLLCRKKTVELDLLSDAEKLVRPKTRYGPGHSVDPASCKLKPTPTQFQTLTMLTLTTTLTLTLDRPGFRPESDWN